MGEAKKAQLQQLVQTFSTGEIIFEEGDTGDVMYVIQKGNVRIVKRVPGGSRTLVCMGPGEFFGEMAIVNNRSRGAAAEAINDCVLLKIDSNKLQRMMSDNVEIVTRMFKKMALRLQEADDHVDILLMDEPSARVVLALLRLKDTRGVDVESGVQIKMTFSDLIERVNLPEAKVDEVFGQLSGAQLAQKNDDGILLSNPKRLADFLAFLEQRAGS